MRFEGDANFPRNSLASHVLNGTGIVSVRTNKRVAYELHGLVAAELCGGGGEEVRADGPP